MTTAPSSSEMPFPIGIAPENAPWSYSGGAGSWDVLPGDVYWGAVGH